jgi:aminopeptidase N
LRLTVGDQDFFQILQEWVTSQAGGHVTTDEFIALAESISGQQLDELFQTWLFTPEKPELEEVAAATAEATATELAQVSGAAGEPVDHRGAKR